MASDLEANMVAVERIQQYFNIKGEAPRLTPADDSLPANWPTRGRIEFIDAMMRYRPGLPLVLKGLTLNIPAQSKVGVVGRTGEFCGVYFGSGLDKSFLSDSSCFPAIKVLGKVHLWLLYFVSWS
jgi:hypothetical protein